MSSRGWSPPDTGSSGLPGDHAALVTAPLAVWVAVAIDQAIQD